MAAGIQPIIVTSRAPCWNAAQVTPIPITMPGRPQSRPRRAYRRGSAACALGHHGYVEASPQLCSQIGATSSAVRFNVAWALCSMGRGGWERMSGSKEIAQKALLTLTSDEDEEVRDWAVFGLRQGVHDTPEVRARFWESIEDECPEVRGEAVSGLANLAIAPSCLG